MESYKWRENEEEDVRSYWMTLRNRQDTGNWNRKHKIAPSRELKNGKKLWTSRKLDCRMNRVHVHDPPLGMGWIHVQSSKAPLWKRYQTFGFHRRPNLMICWTATRRSNRMHISSVCSSDLGNCPPKRTQTCVSRLSPLNGSQVYTRWYKTAKSSRLTK